MAILDITPDEAAFLLDSIAEIKELYLEDGEIELFENTHNLTMVHILEAKLTLIENQKQ